MLREINQKATREKMRQLRLEKGFTQDEIAELIEGSRTTYCSMEKGTKELNEKYLMRLAQAYNIEFEELCIYAESEYDKLERTMNILDSYRPTNYYMIRHGNLAEDLADLIKYFEKGKITEYNLIDPMLSGLGFEIKLININAYLEKWRSELELNNSRTVINNAKIALSFFGDENDKEVCVLLYHRNERYLRCLLNIDKYIELEKFLFLSLDSNLENLFREYNEMHRSLSKDGAKDLDSIISNNMKEEDKEAYLDSLIHTPQAKHQLLKIDEYIKKLLEMEHELKQKRKKEKDNI